MSDTQDVTRRLKDAQDALKSDGRFRPKTHFYHVQWHVRKKTWVVKVRLAGHQFYKKFPEDEEAEAAWVADVAAMMIHGPNEARSMTASQISRCGRTNPLNYDWSKGVPECPGKKYTVYDVYNWIIERKVPVRFKPSAIK